MLDIGLGCSKQQKTWAGVPEQTRPHSAAKQHTGGRPPEPQEGTVLVMGSAFGRNTLVSANDSSMTFVVSLPSYDRAVRMSSRTLLILGSKMHLGTIIARSATE